ncbi:MAG: glycosyltransferase family 2 protein [Planctomycetota bacterium]
MFFWLHIVLGPLPWVLMLVGMWSGRAKMARLRRAGPQTIPEQPPTVTVVVPGKDEEGHIADTLASVLALDWPDLRVIAVDDRSTDRTPGIIDELAARDERLTAVHIETLPDGWLGKCHALWSATREVESEWLLFVDSDVLVEPGALRDALGLALTRDFQAVSLLSRLRPRGLLEHWLVPVCAAAWAVMFAISQTNEPSRKGAAANGQFFLVRRDVYEQVGGHEAVRAKITEDVALMRNIKNAGHRTRLFSAPHLVSTQMHATWAQIRNGWTRIYTGTADGGRGRIALALVIVLGVLASLVLLPWSPVASVVHIGLVAAWLVAVYVMAGVAWWPVVLLPGTFVALAVVLGGALGRGEVDWRGSAVSEPGGHAR